MEFEKEERCRLCLSEDLSGESIFDSRDDGVPMSAKIMVCTSIMVSEEDQYSKYLCNNCADMLDLFFDFKNTCFKTFMTIHNDREPENLEEDTPIIGIQDDQLEELGSNSENEKFSKLSDSLCSFRNKNVSEKEDGIYNEGIDGVDSGEVVLEGREINTNRQFQVGCYLSLTDEQTENDESNLKRRFKCTSCKKIFTTLIELDTHWEMCGSIVEDNIQTTDIPSIDLCYNDIFEDDIVNESEEGTSVKKNSRNKEFCCETCGQVFKQLWLLQRHIQVKHIKVRPFSCPHCNRKFFDKYELKYHQRLHQDIEDFCCNVCGRRFARRSGLRAHMRSHTGEKPYNCNTCGKSFAHLNSLATHERIHTGVRPYSCKYCTRTFAQYSTAKSHEEMHKGGLRLHQCDVCDRMFKTEIELSAHTVGHEGNFEHHCTICDRFFKKMSELKNHEQRFHSRKKPFSCDQCPKSYMTSNELKTHMTIHTGELPHTCPYCSKRYRIKATLRKHLNKYHSSNTHDAISDSTNIDTAIF